MVVKIRKTPLMKSVERDWDTQLEVLLPRMVADVGASQTADSLGVSPATIALWLGKMGCTTQTVVLAPGQTVEIKDPV